MAKVASSSEDISMQANLLQSEVCPTVPDPKGCVRMLPEFWGDLGPPLWRAYFSDWMCKEGCTDGEVSKWNLTKDRLKQTESKS